MKFPPIIPRILWSPKTQETRLIDFPLNGELVSRRGECNVRLLNLNQRRSRFLQDLYTTLVDVRWRWTLLVFFMAFIASWLIFAFLWYLIIRVHADDQKSSEDVCIQNVKTFTGCFLFSIETQHTIGYGYRYTTEKCPEAIIIMCIQSIVGVILQAFMVGVVFAKLTRPKKRTNTVLFSRNVVVCLRDGNLCMAFRVGDMRKSFIIGATAKAQLIRKRSTLEGEIIPFHHFEVNVGSDSGSQSLFFVWPLTIVHVIDVDSPFYHMSALDLMNENFELVVYVEGTAESTGTTVQARSSYHPPDILWGHRFRNIISFDKNTENFVVDFSIFNSTVEVATPLCSAAQLDDFKRQNEEQILCLSNSDSVSRLMCLEPELFQMKGFSDSSASHVSS